MRAAHTLPLRFDAKLHRYVSRMVGGRWYRRAATRATPRSHAARKKRIAPAV